MFKTRTKKTIKKTLRILVTAVTLLAMSGLGNILPGIPSVPSASAAVTTKIVTGLTTWNQVVAPGETVAVFGINLVGDSDELFNSLTLKIMGPTSSLVALSGTASLSGVKIVQDHILNGTNGVYDSFDTVLLFEGTAPSWNSNYEATFDIVDSALENDDLNDHLGNDYFVVITTKPAAQILSSSMFGFEINVGGIAVTGDSNVPNSRVEANHIALDAGTVVINEIVTDPQRDWSNTAGGDSIAFTATYGNGTIDTDDEWIELYIKRTGLNLTNWTIALDNASAADTAAASLTNTGAFDYSLYEDKGVNGCTGTFTSTCAGDYLVLGNVDGGRTMDNNIQITLSNASGTVDVVALGTFADGSTWDNGPAGTATGVTDESVGRNVNSKDMDYDSEDFSQQTASPGAVNDTPPIPVDVHLLDSDPMRNTVVVEFSELITTTTAETTGNYQLETQSNASPTAATKSGINMVTLVFAETITANSDTLAISGVQDTGGLSGTYTAVEIYSGGSPGGDDDYGSVMLINEVVTNPQSDWSVAGYSGTNPGGPGGTEDEYIEILINRNSYDLTGTSAGNAWTMRIFDTNYDTLYEGNLVAYDGGTNANGLFATVNYTAAGAGTASNTAIGDFLILGDLQTGNLSDNIRIELEDPFGVTVDQVTIGSFNDGYTGDNAVAGGGTVATESIGRNSIGADTGVNSTDFNQQPGTPGATNVGFTANIAISSVFINNPTEIGIDFTEAVSTEIATTNAAKYFNISPSIAMSSSSISSVGGGRFVTVSLASPMTDQAYTFTVSKNNSIYDWGTDGTDGVETVTSADYVLQGMAQDLTAPLITGVNVINSTEIEILFTEDNGINIYGADDAVGGSSANADAIFQFSPGLGVVTAQSMWDRVRLTTATAQTSGTTYTVTISNLRDRAQPTANVLSSNSHGGTTDNQTTFTGFNSSSFDDGQSPYVMHTMPLMGEDSVPINIKRLRIGFSEAMNPSSLTFTSTTASSTADNIMLGKVDTANWSLDAGNLIALESVTYDSASQAIEIVIPTATANLTANTPYMLFVRGDNNNTQIGVSDISGAEMTWDFMGNFWTSTGADTTKPQVQSTNIDADYPSYTGIPVGLSAIIIHFDEAMNPSTIIDDNTADTSNNITLTYSSGGSETKVAGRVNYNIMGKNAEFVPSAALVQNTNYTLKVTTGATDVAGNALNSQFTQLFTTGGADSTAPTIDHADSGGYMIWVQFSEPVQSAQATNLSNWTLVSGGSAVSLSTAQIEYYSWENGVEIRGLSLTAGDSFTITVASTLQDLAGNAIGSTNNTYTGTIFNMNTWNDFPMMTESYPYPWASGVPVSVILSANFSEALDAASVHSDAYGASESDTVRLYKVVDGVASTTLIAGTSTYYSSSKTITFEPTANLNEDQDYRLSIGVDCAPGQVCNMAQSIKDAGGVYVPFPFFVDFRTGAGTDTTAPTLSTSNPLDSATGVAVGLGAVSMFFSEALNPATLNNTNIKFALAANIGAGPYISGVIEYDPMGYIIDFKPSTVLAVNTNYTLRITTNVTDAAGVAVATDIDIDFQTTAVADVTSPYVDFSNADPFGIFIKFTEPITQTTAENIRNYSLISVPQAQDLDSGADAYTVSLQGRSPEYHFMDNSVYIPNLNLTSGNKYRVTVTNVTDLAGNSINTNTDSSSAVNFRIVEATNIQFNQHEGTIFDMTYIDDTVYVMYTFPMEWNVPTGTNKIKIGFSEALDNTTVSSSSILVIPQSSGVYSDANNITDDGGVTIAWNSASNEVIISGFTLVANTEYKVKVTTAVKDGGGNTMMAWNPWDSNDTTAYESFFKTASTAGNDTTVPTVWGTNLEQYRNVNDQIVNVPLWFGAIDIMFSEQMDEDTIRAVDGAASSTVYISGATTTVTVDPGTTDTTLTLGSITNVATSSRIMITENGLTDVYAEVLSLDIPGKIIEINKQVGVDFTAAAIVTRLLKGFVDYDPWDKRATFIAEEPLGQNKTYRLNIRNRAQDITGNNMAADVAYKFTTANTADTSSPIITFTEAESFQIMIWFNKPLQKSLAENVRNYTLESPIGKNVNLDGKTIVYDTMEQGVFISGLNLTSNNTFRLTVSTRVLDLTGNAVSDATSTDNRPLTEPSGGSEIIERQYEGYVMAHFEDFFGGKDAMIAADTFTFDNMMFDNFMNNVQVMPMNPMVGKTTNYFVNFPVTTAIPLGGQIVIKFPEGFDLSAADTMNIFDSDDPATWGPENSPMNNDINGWSAGAVTIASVATSSAARTITITTGGATTTGSDFISIDLRGIKNPSSPHESPDYKATISTKDTGGEPLEGPFSSQPIFIQPKGTNIIQGTITVPDADTSQEIRVELYGPAGMQGETLVINDGKVNGAAGATITEGAGIAKYKFSDLPPGSYNISVMDSDFSQMVTVLSSSVSTEYFAPMGHDILWVDSGDTKDYNMTLVKATYGVAWTDNWDTERVMYTLTVVVTGGTENDKAKVNVSGPGQFFSKEIIFDSDGSAVSTFNVPEDMYWVDVQPYMPKATFTMGPMPPPPFLSPPGIDVFVNNRKDGSEVIKSDRIDISLAGRSADNYLQITVRDSVNLTGVNNVEVFAHNPVGFGVPPVITNSSGVTTLKLPPGVYMVGAIVPGFPPIPDRSVTITASHTEGSPATLVFDVKMDLSNTFKISGTVKDVSGNLQANVPVWAEERNSSDTLFVSGNIPAMTNSEGAFEFRVVSGSSWRIQAYIPGYGDTDSISILSIAADRTTGADLTAKSELAIITGTIVLNAVAVQGAFVFAEGISGTYGFHGIHTSNDGTFSLRVDEGTYKIVASSPEFGEKILVASQTVSSSQALNSSTIALDNQEIKLGQAARTLTLEFRDSAGASSTPEEVFVEVRDSSGNGRTETFKSVDSGTITIPDGTYTVSVYTKESGTLTPFTNVVIDGAKDGVENDADSLVVTIADYVEITGKLYNDTNSDNNWDAGEELADAFVSVFSETSGATFSARTDSSGDYTIKVPVDDTYQLTADKNDYIASSPQEFIVTSTAIGGDEFNYNIDAKDTDLAISGSVYFDSAVSANLANNTTDKAMVWAESSDGKWVSANIEADGSYTLYVSAGEWDVKASGHGGYETTEANKTTVTVVATEVTGNNFVLSPISGYTQGASQSNPFYSDSEGRAFSADNSVMVTAPANSIVNSETKADININIQPTTNVPEKMNKVTSVNGAPVVSNPFTPLVDKAFEITATVDGATKNVLDGSVNIQFSYADYSTADKAAIEADPSIFKCQYLNEAGQWEPTDISILDTDNELLICPTDHFSTYAPSLPTNILAPATTTGATVTAGNAQNVITWTQNTEGDMAHYIVWETEVTEGQVTTVLDSACSGSSCAYTHTGLTNGTTYGYQILAVDDSGYTAAGSSRVTAAPVAPPSTGSITHLPSTASASTYTPDVATTTDDTTTTTEDGEVADDVLTTDDTIQQETIGISLVDKIASLSTKPVAQMTISELKVEITKIAEIIAELQIELVKIFGETTVVIVGVPAAFKFEITLKKEMVSNDVKYMQIVLNSNPETQLASSGVGSPGNETNYFGPLTERGVIKFQEKYAQDILAPWNLTSGTGLVGSTTRAKLNSWLGK